MKIVAVMLYSGVGANSYERDMIVRCLESIQGFVDGIVMVDTGGTAEIIKVAADYAVSLYHSPWTSHFAKHRNEALEYAMAEYPEEDVMWFIIDPDESLVEPEVGFEEAKKRLAKTSPLATALAVLVHEVNPESERTASWRGIRFFKKAANLKYKNIIHNKPVIDGNAAMTNVELNHYGYSYQEDKKQEKWIRTNKNLKESIGEDSRDHRTCYYLCQNSASLRRYEEAIFWGIRAIQYFPYPDDPTKLNFYGGVYYTLGMSYARIGNAEESYRWLNHGLSLFPDDLDLNFAMALIGVRALRKDLFMPHAEKYLQVLDGCKNPEQPKTFASTVAPEDYLERNIHHITSESEMDIRHWIEHWDELEEQAA